MSPVNIIEKGKKTSEIHQGISRDFEFGRGILHDFFGFTIHSERQGFGVTNLDFKFPCFSFSVLPETEIKVIDEVKEFMDKNSIKLAEGKIAVGNRVTFEATSQSEEEIEDDM
jgi:hypothetical protein